MNKQKPRAGIVGYGYVGKAIHAFLQRSHECRIFDPAFAESNTKDEVNECDFVVVSVPTPMQDNGAVDLSYIQDVFSWLKTPLIIIKSTVPPGTTQQLIEKKKDSLICFSPEYIGEGKYPVPFWDNIPHATEMSYHSFHIFGGSPEATNKAIEYWKRAAGPFAKYVQTDSTTAELVKYAENSWIATKITYVNELFDIAGAFGVDYNELRELWLLDGRVGMSHTVVYEKARGFSGKCIPKDTNGIVEAAKAKGYEPKLLENVLKINEEFIKKNPE